MKVRALCGDARFEVDLREGSGDDQFELALTDAEGNKTCIEVRVLSTEGDRWVLESAGTVHDLLLEENDGGIRVEAGEWSRTIEIVSPRDRLRSTAGRLADDGLVTVRAQMPGKVVRVAKEVGDPVAAAEGVVVIEAMKMQNEIQSPRAGTLVACSVEEGQSVGAGEILFEIE